MRDNLFSDFMRKYKNANNNLLNFMKNNKYNELKL